MKFNSVTRGGVSVVLGDDVCFRCDTLPIPLWLFNWPQEKLSLFSELKWLVAPVHGLVVNRCNGFTAVNKHENYRLNSIASS